MALKSKARQIIAWLVIAIAPILIIAAFEVREIANGYDGQCGLLDAAWKCSKAEYISEVFFSPFAMPLIIMAVIAWLVLLFSASFVIRWYKAKHPRKV